MPRCSTIQRQIRLALGPLMVLDELCSDPIQRIMDFLQIRTISMRNDSKYRCRVCGFRSEDPPWGQDEGTPLYDFCICCGVEHGYQDSSIDGARRYRDTWIEGGAKWEIPGAKPDGWNLDEQLRHIPTEFQ